MSTSATISFASGQSDEDPLGGAIPLTCNMVVDSQGVMRMRPGISAWSDFPTAIPSASPITSMAVWRGMLVYTTLDRKLWAVDSPGHVVALSDGTAATQLDGSTRPVPVSAKARVIFAGGGAPQKWEGTGLSSRLLGNNVAPPLPTAPLPPPTTHLAAVATRLIAADRSVTGAGAGIIYWSNLLDSGNEVWDPLNFLELSSRPDRVVALYDNSKEVFGFGETTVEMVRPDPNQGFVSGFQMNAGLAAPYSPVRYDESMLWIADRRRFLISDGRDYTDIGPNMRGFLQALPTVADAWGFEVRFNQFRLVSWNLPTAGRCFAWNKDHQRWSEFRGFGNSDYQPLPISSSIVWTEQDRNLNLVGLNSGQIAKWDEAATTDLGIPIKAEIISGYHNRGTMNRKKCNQISLAFRPLGNNLTVTVLVYWRDDTGAWMGPLVATVDGSIPVSFRTLGVYRLRQWRIVFTDAQPFTFVGALEEFEVLDS